MYKSNCLLLIIVIGVGDFCFNLFVEIEICGFIGFVCKKKKIKL